MLIRSGGFVGRRLFVAPKIAPVQALRFRSPKAIKKYRQSSWIGNKNLSDGDVTEAPVLQRPIEIKLIKKRSLYANDEKFKETINEAYNDIRERVSTNDFRYAKHDNGTVYSYSSKLAFDEFREQLIKSLNKAHPPNLVLESLVAPHIDIIPFVTHSLLYNTKPDSKASKLLSSFFEKKGLATMQDKLGYVFEESFHHIMDKQMAADLPAQAVNVDISNPEEWYPAARRLKRKLILHMGPTNSGKTYHALQRLKQSNDGYYAGPLRLLAREIYDKFKSEGIRCNLVTGEEVIEDRDEFGIQAPLSSGTVEMIPVNQRFEVVVIDEIQMIADSFRGWAWSHALLGAQADEIHLCGEESVIPLIKKIAESTGDEVIINRYERLGELQIEDRVVHKGLLGLEKGDCIVAFSKKRIMAYKEQIQASTKLKCGVIYGALPAETRATEAEKFNNGEYDVLVASDAIGMGLNLSINRVIFDSHKKFDGKGLVNLETPQVKQIGGRAGRFKSPGAEGEKVKSLGKISAFYPDTLKFIKEAINTPTIFLNRADVWPSDTIWSLYTSTFPAKTKLKLILETFHKDVENTELYRISSLRDRLSIAQALIRTSNMLVGDQLRVSTAPLSTMLPKFYAVIEAFARNVVTGFSKSILDFPFLKFDCLNRRATEEDLNTYEELHKYVLLFLWMNNRYPSYFVDRECAVDIKESLEAKIETALRGRQHKRMGLEKKDRPKDGRERIRERNRERRGFS